MMVALPMGELGWARCLDNVADILRRGAWYPVVEETGDGHLVVSVRDERVRLSRHDVRMRPDAPTHWSVVVRTGVLRPTLGGKDGGGDDVRRLSPLPRAPGLQRQARYDDLPALRPHVVGGLVGDLLTATARSAVRRQPPAFLRHRSSRESSGAIARR